MRVLVTTTGYPGHFLPLVPFARACIRAGHEVLVAAPRSQVPVVERAGLTVRACANPEEDELARIVATVAGLNQKEGHARMMSEGFAGIAARVALPDLAATVREWRPDVVLHESQDFAGPVAAQLSGVPSMRVALGQAAHEQETLAATAASVNALRRAYGLPGDRGARARIAAPYLTLLPSLLERSGVPGPPSTHRFREPRNGAASLPGALAGRDEPLVYVTFGSVAGRLGLFPALYRSAIDSLTGLRARVLVTVGDDADPAELGPPPDNVHVERWIDQGVILANADAVVCHGGYGSVLGALAHGAPLVVVPMFGNDQWSNAARVVEVGAGVVLGDGRGPLRRMFDGPDPQAIADLPKAIEAVLTDPGYRLAAAEVAGEIESLRPVDAAVGLLESIANERTTR